MSLSGTEKEIQCVLHWFQSWSPLQKGDFLKDLVDKAVPEKVSTLFDALSALDVKDKPPSIFKCQIQLFNQWFEVWTDKERNDCMRMIEEIDPEFIARFSDAVASTALQP